MKAVVVYESLWGNTAQVAKAIAEGLGPEVPALTTDEASGEALEGVDLIVAGAPIHGFRLPNESSRNQTRSNTRAPRPPDLSHPSLRSWLDALPEGNGRSAAFETGFRASPGGKSAILRKLEHAGFKRLKKGERFLVAGAYGPLRDGELERARQWGAELARLAG
jgi:hypothetical protein